MLFDPKRNLKKDDRVTKNFINRLENARTEESKKKERFENLGKVKVNNFTYNNPLQKASVLPKNPMSPVKFV